MEDFYHETVDYDNIIEAMWKNRSNSDIFPVLWKIFWDRKFQVQELLASGKTDVVDPVDLSSVHKFLKKDSNAEIMIMAASDGLLNVLAILILSGADPGSGANGAIQSASKNGHLAVVDLLLQDERVDPSDGDNCAIQWV